MQLMAVNVKYVLDVIKSVLPVLRGSYQKSTIGVKGLKSPNLKHGELRSLYDNVLFIFECFHHQQDSQWREKASRKYRTRKQ